MEYENEITVKDLTTLLEKMKKRLSMSNRLKTKNPDDKANLSPILPLDRSQSSNL